MEGKALRINTTTIITKFLYECILTRFGCPLIIVRDQGVHVINDANQIFDKSFSDETCECCTYYPQGNGQAQLTNKVLRTLLTKLVNENRIDWDDHLSTMFFHIKLHTK
jgi:hypothetical protein